VAGIGTERMKGRKARRVAAAVMVENCMMVFGGGR